MKKTLLFSILLTGIALFGCDSNNKTNLSISGDTQVNPETPSTDSTVSIDEAKAREIALQEVANGVITKLEYDLDAYVPHYDIEILDGVTEYEFKISAIDGSVLRQSNKVNASSTHQVAIDEAKAREIALQQVANGVITKFKYDLDYYIPNYDIEISDGTTEYEFEISAIDGSILEQSNELNPSSTHQVAIDEEKAREIALQEVANGVITEFEFDSDDSVPKYDVEVSDGTTKYEFEISAIDGSIISREVEKIGH